MSIFDEVKAYVTAAQVASHYGLKISANGKACCPFHPDKHPSLKIDRGYYCFGCGAKGDAIGYVAQLFGLRQYSAAIKIIEDFHLPIETKPLSSQERLLLNLRYQQEQRRKARIRQKMERFQKWRLAQIDQMQEIKSNITTIFHYYQNAPPEEVFASDAFQEAVQAEPIIEYWLDILCLGDIEEQQEFYINNREGVNTHGERIKKAVQSLVESDRADHR